MKQLRTELPKLLRDDVEVRGQVIAVLSEYLTTREETAAILAELRQMRADFDRRFEEQGRRIDEHSGHIATLAQRIEEQGRRIDEHSGHIATLAQRIEEQGRRLEEQTSAIRQQTEDMRALQRTVVGLGSRWGLMAEEAFRSGIQAMFAHQTDVEVSRWLRRDDRGEVFGYAADVELDIVVRDGTHLIAEIKSSISAADVMVFARKAEFYRRVTGHEPTRRLMIGPFVEERAFETAKHFDIEISAGVSPPKV